MSFQASHPFLTTYLKYVENTESPRLFHIWSALGCIGAAMGRRCWLDIGIELIYPNMYIALVGPPAMRKGSAIKAATRLLRETTKVKFAPNDTGGQRQGFIRALLEEGDEDADKELLEAMGQINAKSQTLNFTDEVELGLSKYASLEFDTRDPHSMFAVASELNSLIGENSTALLTFLQEMWDGAHYKYQLKNTSTTLTDALMSILAGTTSSQISVAMPPEAIGGGFTSRIIFVHGDAQYKRVARPSFDTTVEVKLKELFSEIFHRFEGEFSESKAAAELYDKIYHRGCALNDTRFLHYIDRRGIHLHKMAMALAASRGSKIIDEMDVEVADKLLIVTEEKMPDAFGEYGMAKLGAAKQRLLEFLRMQTGPTPTHALYGMVNKDMTNLDFKNVIADLLAARKITMHTIGELGECVTATDVSAARRARHEVNQLTELLKVS